MRVLLPFARSRFIVSMLALFLSQAAFALDLMPAPEINLQDARGNEVHLPRKGDHLGADIYLFWATWCPYCKALMPHLQSLIDEHDEQVRVYAINIKEDGDPMAYLREQGYNFILLPEADEAATAYGVKTTPGVFVINRNGEIYFDLNDLITTDSAAFKALNNRQKAARRAPWWAAEIRQAVDDVLLEGANLR